MATPVIWLPLNGDLHNQGTQNIKPLTNNGNASFEDGKLGKCIHFNNSYLSVNEIDYSSFDSGFSISVWFKIPTLPTSNSELICIGPSNGWANLRFVIVNNNTNLYTSVSNGTNYVASNCNTTIAANTWYHYCATYKNRTLSVYLDGVLKKSITTTFDATPSTTTGLGIGAAYNGSEKLNCCVSDLRLYDKTLSLKEIKELAQGLVLHYPLNGNGFGSSNLILNTMVLTPASSKTTKNCSVRGSATRQLRTDGFYEAKCTASWQGISTWSNMQNFAVGDKITYSFYIYGNGSSRAFSFYPMMYNSGGTRDTSTGLPISLDGGAYTTVNAKAFTATTTTVPEKHYATFEWNQSMKDILDAGGSIELSIQVHGTWNTGDWACLFAPKLEKGEIPTIWSPNENDDSILTKDIEIKDCSGFGHNGSYINNPIYTSGSYDGRYISSLSLNGTDQGVQFQSSDFNTFFNNVWTISFWIYSNGENGGRSIYFSSYNASPFWCLEKSAGNAIRYDWNGSPDQYGNGGKIVDGKWNHIVLVKYSNTSCKSYINGVLDKEMTTAVSALTLNNPIWRIGRDVRTGDGTPYKGNICDFRIYATALVEDDIKKLYNTSMSIDNLQRLHAYEFIENKITNPKFYKNGIVEVEEFIEQDNTSSNYTDKIIMDELIEI